MRNGKREMLYNINKQGHVAFPIRKRMLKDLSKEDTVWENNIFKV